MIKFTKIDDYILHQPEKTRNHLFVLKECILSAVPECEQLFNYNIPAFSLVKNGKRDQQIMIAGYKHHVGFYPHPTTIQEFADKLIDYKTSKGAIQFPLDKPIPCNLIIEMVKYRQKILLENKK